MIEISGISDLDGNFTKLCKHLKTAAHAIDRDEAEARNNGNRAAHTANAHTANTHTLNQMVEDKAKAMVAAAVDAVVEIEVVDVEVILAVAVLVVLLLFSRATR
jgi:hypothetical protein